MDCFFPISIASLWNGTTEADLAAVLSNFRKIRRCFIPSPVSTFIILGSNKEADTFVREFNGALANCQKLVVRKLSDKEIHSLDLLQQLF